MTTDCPEADSAKTPVRRSSSKSFKKLIRIFKSDAVKTSNMKIRIPSFRENRKHSSSSHQQQQLHEHENILKEIPALDFRKLKADLYVDLAYTNNLLRQRVHRDNLTNLVAQITECLRLIRCRVATAAAYIQTDSPYAPSSSLSTPNAICEATPKYTATASESSDGQNCSENRVILEAVSRFENAYLGFAGWLTEMAALNPPPMEVLPVALGGEIPAGQPPVTTSVTTEKKGKLRVTLPLPPVRPPSAVHSNHWSLAQDVATPDDVGEVMARGNACFLAIQTAAESVFLTLEASGSTRPTTPKALSCVNGAQSPLTKVKQPGFLSFHFPRASPLSNGKSTTGIGATSSESVTRGSLHEAKSSRGGGLTLEDRRLLSQLWLQMEPTGGSSPPPPPPKPPFSLESPQWSAGESLADMPASPLPDCLETGYTNVRADAKLNAYLRSLAEAVQGNPTANGSNEQMEESVWSKLDSPGPTVSPLPFCSLPPPDLPPRNGSSRKNCLDLNALNLPHADDSDASEKENEREEGDSDDSDRCRTENGKGLRPGPLIFLLNSKTSLLQPPPPPPPPPPPTDLKTPVRESCNPAIADLGVARAVNGQTRNSPRNDETWEPLESATIPSNVVTSLARFEVDPLSDTLMQGEVLNALKRMQNGCYQEVDPKESAHYPEGLEKNSEHDNENHSCRHETKSDTEDDFEIIFANGKKYKRYFKRHIVLQRHVCKQVVVAPSLPDGSGPDLSRQVLQGRVQTCHLGSMPTCLSTLTPSKGNCNRLTPNVSQNGLLRGVNDGDFAFTPITAITQGDDSSCNCNSGSHGNTKPPTLPNQLYLSSTLTNYMYKFGRLEPQDAGLENCISHNVADLFHTSKWCKRESAQGPHERSKTVAYMQKYSQPTASGPHIQHNTCAQQTCRVRMVGGLEELRQKTPSIPIVNTPSTGNSTERWSPITASSPSPTFNTLPRSTRGRSLSRGPLSIVDRRNQKVRPTLNLPLPRDKMESRKGPLTIRVPSGSQPLLTELAGAVGLGYQDHRRRLSHRKHSLEGSSPETDTKVTFAGNLLSPYISLINVELPSVVDAERLHPILMELDATPYLELDNSNSENELQVQAGTVDALIVYATSLGCSHRSFLLTLDVFLVIYRTFITTEELINLLVQRYLLFQSSITLIASIDEKTREKICNVVLSYLIRVISKLSTDLDSQIYSLLRLFRERVMDDGYGGLARALDFTLSLQLKRCTLSRSLGIAPQTSATTNTSSINAFIYPQTNEKAYESASATTTASPSVCFRRSNSIGAVAGAMISLPSPPLKNGGFKITASNTPWGSARNSFSIGMSGESPHLSSPTASTAALSDFDFEAASTTGTAIIDGRPSTVSCFSSPTSSRHLFGPSMSITLTTTQEHLRNGSRRANLLDVPSKQLAEQITFLEAEKYSRLTLEELLDIKSLSALKAPVMAACAAQFTALSNWAATLLLTPSESQCERYALKLLKVMNHLHALKNFNSFLAILCAFLLVPENIFSKKTRARLDRLRPYMQPPHFSTYRRELIEATPPLIPYLGLTLQNLIALDQINPRFLPDVPKGMLKTYKPEHGPIVNFWRCWKHFLIINFFVKQDSADARAQQYDIKPDLDTLDLIADFKTAYPDFALRELITRRKREAS